jgi:hypothetical protein
MLTKDAISVAFAHGETGIAIYACVYRMNPYYCM